MSDLKWYVVRAVSGQEKKAKTYLEKEVEICNLTDYVVQVLTPTEKVYQIRKQRDGKTKKVAVERNFFPGYIFVQADLSHGEVMHMIKGVPGIIGFLNTDGRDPNDMPQSMRESEIKRMLGRSLDTDQPVIESNATYAVGETVNVMDGPFNGFSGVVQEVFEEKKKLNVMVKIFGRNTPVELNYIQVEKV